MATFTSRFNLRKPAGTDLVSPTTDIAENMDKIDAMLPVGMLTAFVGTAAPTGWLLCNGATVSRTTYSALFAVIGTRYGAGDGATTFTLPDLRNKVPSGQLMPGDPVSVTAIGAHVHSTAVTTPMTTTGAVSGGNPNLSHNHGNVTNGAGGTDFTPLGHIHDVNSTHSHGAVTATSPVPVQSVNYIVKT